MPPEVNWTKLWGLQKKEIHPQSVASTLSDTLNDVSFLLAWIDIPKWLNLLDWWKLVIEINNILPNLEVFKTELSRFISEVFEWWQWFNWLNRSLLETLLYWSINEIKAFYSWKQEVELAQSLSDKKVKESALSLIYNWVFLYNESEVWSWDFSKWNSDKALKVRFDKLSDKDKISIKSLLWENNYPPILNIDQLLMYLWLKWIRYWLQYSLIKKRVNWVSREELEWVIDLAIPKLAISDTKDKVELKTSIHPKRTPKVGQNDRADIKKYECIFPQVKAWEVIIVLVKWRNWSDWIWVDWRPLVHKKETPIDVESNIEEWSNLLSFSKKVDKDWNEVIEVIALEDLFISKTKSNKLVFWKNIINKEDIDSSTWSIEVINAWTVFHQKWWIDTPYILEWWEVIVSKWSWEQYITWWIKAIKNITIQWWWIVISWWYIETMEWQISIDEWNSIHSNTLIKALNWKVVINWDIEHTEIESDEIEINWNVRWCNFRWRKITINWKVENSSITWKNLDIKVDNWGNTIVLLIFYTLDKLKRHLDFIKNSKLTAYNKKLKSLETEIQNEQNPQNKIRLEEHKRLLEKKTMEDMAYQEWIEKFLKRFEEEYKDVLKLWKTSNESNIILYPVDFILLDDLYKHLDTNFEEGSRKWDKEDFYSTLWWINFFSDEKSVKVNWTQTVTFQEWYKLLLKHLINLSERLKDINSPRLDSRRYIMYKWDANDLYSQDNTKRKEATEGWVEVSIDWFKLCYINDLSLKWSSFIIPKKKWYFSENSTVDVDFNLQYLGNDWKMKRIHIKTTFWITRITEWENHMKISGLYLDSKVEKDLSRFLNYLETKWKS